MSRTAIFRRRGRLRGQCICACPGLDPVTNSVDGGFSNERNTLGMFGSGVIEMLAREMSADLHAIRDEARQLAEGKGLPVRRLLETKGVSFGAITVFT